LDEEIKLFANLAHVFDGFTIYSFMGILRPLLKWHYPPSFNDSPEAFLGVIEPTREEQDKIMIAKKDATN